MHTYMKVKVRNNTAYQNKAFLITLLQLHVTTQYSGPSGEGEGSGVGVVGVGLGFGAAEGSKHRCSKQHQQGEPIISYREKGGADHMMMI